MKAFYSGVLAVVLAAAAGCGTRPAMAPRATPPARAAATAPKPRLVVLLIVDGLPQWQALEYRDQLAADGLRRFLDRGAWFSQAHYGHSATVTAPGHATIASGAYPHRHGIIGNEWRHPATGEVEYCVADPAHTYIGHRTARRAGTSPRNLRAETLGDVLRGSSPASKVVAVSAKDRAAIPSAGRRGTAYVYMAQSGQFTSTTYYMKDLPQWVKDFNARKPADAFFHQVWKPLLPETAYRKSLADGQKWHARAGRLPKKLGEGAQKPGPAFYAEVAASPFGDRLLLDFARAAIAGESLGQDEAPDILAVSLSAHDAVNHSHGAESRLSHDQLLQLDRLVEEFLRHLDATIGKAYVAVLTSDHGFMPAPEHSQSLGRGGGRLNGGATVARINAMLNEKFTPGPYIAGGSGHSLVFNRAIVARNNVDPKALAEEARRGLLAQPGIEAAYTRAEIESGSRAGAAFFDAIRRSFHRDLSGDIQFALKPYWMVSSGTTGTTHGSPHAYDTHVPLMLYGPGWVRPGRHDARVEMVDLAPTLARILGIPAPAAAEGRPLPVAP